MWSKSIQEKVTYKYLLNFLACILSEVPKKKKNELSCRHLWIFVLEMCHILCDILTKMTCEPMSSH